MAEENIWKKMVGNMLRAGKNINIMIDGDDTFISAPEINKTVVKSGNFILSGDNIEIIAGEGIKISSASPNRLFIGINIDKDKERLVLLERRVENLEKVIADLLKA